MSKKEKNEPKPVQKPPPEHVTDGKPDAMVGGNQPQTPKPKGK